MSDLDDALAQVWEQTSVDTAPLAFNAGVFEQIARRRARLELGVAALIAVAVWAVAMALGPLLMRVMTQMGVLIVSAPVLIAMGMVGAGIGLVALMQVRRRVDRDWWTLGLRG